MKKTLTEEEAKSIYWEDNPDYKEVEDQGWEDEGKYSFGSKIFQDKDGKFWKVGANRSGSYFTDYDYNYNTEIFEVEQKEITTMQWVNKKLDKWLGEKNLVTFIEAVFNLHK